jgi:SAM-dependent methyltransferase
MANTQGEIFLEFEGDHWFERNRGALSAFDPTEDLPLRVLELYRLNPRRVLEVGASNGFRLAAIGERYGAQTVAVEPSEEAIRDGRQRYPQVEFVRGRADATGLQQPFDLVIVNFVFHWVDRALLLRSVAEVDCLLVDGGFLVIGDFYPMIRARVPYHHLPGHGVFTYKQDYAAIFLASGLYRPLCLLTGHHARKGPSLVEDDRDTIACHLLRKEDGSSHMAMPS